MTQSTPTELFALPDRSLRLEVCPALALERQLPPGSDILVKVGDRVEPGTVIAREPTDDRLHLVKLEVDEGGVLGTVIKSVGDECKRGESICFRQYFFGLGYKEYVSPADGVVESFDPAGGWLVIREHPRPVRALLPGVVSGVVPGLSVSITTSGLRVGARAGAGGLGSGRGLPLTEAVVPPGGAAGRVLLVRGTVDHGFLVRALSARAAGVVCGSAAAADLLRFEAYLRNLDAVELQARSGPELPGREEPEHTGSAAPPAARYAPAEVSLPVICLSGYGNAPVEEQVWDRLRRTEGAAVFLDARMVVRGRRQEPFAVVALD